MRKGLIKHWKRVHCSFCFLGGAEPELYCDCSSSQGTWGRKSEQGFFISLLCDLLVLIYDTLFSEVGN